jgi:hypothetical protein
LQNKKNHEALARTKRPDVPQVLVHRSLNTTRWG